MILDASAVVAIVTNEPERAEFLDLASASSCSMSTASWLEACSVVDNRSPGHAEAFDRLLDTLEVRLVDVTVEQARAARAAHRRYGRGSGSPARLNYGNCFAYALALTTGDTLLFKGDDFGHTDIRPAAPSTGPPAG